MAGYPGPSYDYATGRFKIGEDARGQDLWWRLRTPGYGMEHGVITGARGTDISGILRVVFVEATVARRFELMVADPLNGHHHCELFAQHARITARNFGATVDLLTDALREIDNRENSGNDYTNPTPECPGILIGIDDADAVLGNKRAARLAAQIVERGRPAGVGLVIASHTVDPADYASNTNLLRRVAEGICPRCGAALGRFTARSRITPDRCLAVCGECGSHESLIALPGFAQLEPVESITEWPLDPSEVRAQLTGAVRPLGERGDR